MNDDLFIELKGVDGYPVIINARYVAFATPAINPAQNGSASRTPVLGCCAIQMATGPILVVRSSMEDLYRLFKGGQALLHQSQ